MHQAADKKSILVLNFRYFLLYKHSLQLQVKFKDVFRHVKQSLVRPYTIFFIKVTLKIK